MVCCVNLAGLNWTLVVEHYTTTQRLDEPDQNSSKSTLWEQYQTMVKGRAPKRRKFNTEQGNAGSPKLGNWPGWRSPNTRLDLRGRNNIGQRIQFEVGQQRYSTATSARLKASANSKLNLIKLDNHKYTGLYKLISNPTTLTLAYSNIKSKPGNMTPGIDKEITLDGISNQLLGTIAETLQNGTFQFKPARRVYIPKSNGSTRPLAIASPRDKIVQEAMRLVLEPIFEPTFSHSSHGFRPGRSCHSALKEISKWNGITWALEGDIKGFFDNVDHHILADLIKDKVTDQRFMDLYWKLVKAGYVERSIPITPEVGVPQGSLISPLLSNIYLDKFDKYMENLIGELSSKEKLISKVNPKMVGLTKEITKLLDKYRENKEAETLRELKRVRKLRNSLNSRIRTGYRIYYIRYADDWIVGILGTHGLAIELRERIADFLYRELKLKLSMEKTMITHLNKDQARFLGVHLWIPKADQAKIVNKYNERAGRFIKSRINQTRMYYAAPIKEILTKLEKNGFIKRYKQNKNRLIPNAITKWIFLDHHAIITKYNSIIHGYLNYFSMVDNYPKFHQIVGYILRHSCAKTLARKFRLKTRAGAFQKFGKNLRVTKNLKSKKSTS